MPGRGGAGRPGPGGPASAPGERCLSFSTRSGRGGTTGRAAGWPARFGLAGGRSGPPPPMAAPAGEAAAPGTFAAAGGRGAGRGGVGILGIKVAAGRGTPGVAAAGGLELSVRLAGKGWRGPERIWPGLGAGGAGLDGTGVPRGAGSGIAGAAGAAGVWSGARTGWPVAKGGRIGAAGLAGAPTGSLGADRARISTSAAGAGSGLPAGGAGSAGSATGAGGDGSACSTAAGGSAPVKAAPFPVKYRRTDRAASSSSELEWVFFSWKPSSGSNSRIRLGLTSSSRANSLMRILLILCVSGGDDPISTTLRSRSPESNDVAVLSVSRDFKNSFTGPDLLS